MTSGKLSENDINSVDTLPINAIIKSDAGNTTQTNGAGTMRATIINVDATSLVDQVADCCDVPTLSQADCPAMPVVEMRPSGRVEIVDGYHRIAGMIAAGETAITCVTCDDADLLGDIGNAEDPERQAQALNELYSAI